MSIIEEKLLETVCKEMGWFWSPKANSSGSDRERERERVELACFY